MPTGDQETTTGGGEAAELRPVFLLSLPRSGSTLVQRVLGAHPAVATAPEPWILLPFLFATREHGAFAEYGHVSAARAISEFAARLPRGREDYAAEVADLARRLYRKAAPNDARYFLDKTPRYHLIADELFSTFPDAPIIFLWRNPLAVVASIVETWTGGRWSLERWRQDLFDGPGNLVAAYRKHRDRAYAVRFEDLVTDPNTTWPAVFAYLDLPYDPEVLMRFASIRLEGRMGDPKGAGRYDRLATDPVDKWKRTLASPTRKRWCRSYLRSLGRDTLQTMGYDLDELLRDLDSAPTDVLQTVPDAVAFMVGRMRRRGRETAARLLWARAGRGGGSAPQADEENGQTSRP